MYINIKTTDVWQRVLHFTAEALTRDLVNFIQEFAFDLLKHVILADFCVVGARGVRGGGGHRRRGGSHGHRGDAGGLSGSNGLRTFEQVELHCQRLEGRSLKHKGNKQQLCQSIKDGFWSNIVLQTLTNNVCASE